MQIKVKITDKYIYLYDKTLKILESKYIKNGRVDNVEKFIRYLRNILNNTFIKRKYIFILDPTLNNSELFVYRYVFDSIGLLKPEKIMENGFALASKLRHTFFDGLKCSNSNKHLKSSIYSISFY